MTYESWIATYVARNEGIVLGRCRSASEEMREAFPELRIVRGHVRDAMWGRRAHWWCVSPGGAIVDPTRAQFPAPFKYEEFEPGTEVRVGRCMNCGDEIMQTVHSLDEEIGHKSICGEACHQAFAGPRRRGVLMGNVVHRLASLKELRACMSDAKAFGFVSGDDSIYQLLKTAVKLAEKYEPEDSFKKCLSCGDTHQRESDYCCFNCAEDDGAIEK